MAEGRRVGSEDREVGRGLMEQDVPDPRNFHCISSAVGCHGRVLSRRVVRLSLRLDLRSYIIGCPDLVWWSQSRKKMGSKWKLGAEPTGLADEWDWDRADEWDWDREPN